MSRSLVVIIIVILLILATATSLAAQGRGHVGGGRGFGSAPVVRAGPSFVARPPVGVGPFHGPAYGIRPVRPIRPVVVAPAFGYYSPYIWPTPYYGGAAYSLYPGPYSASLYPDEAYSYTNPNTQPPAASQNEIDLAYQVGQLSAQVEQLRQQQGITSYTQPLSPQQRSSQSTSTPVALVFRDGRRMDVQNYAIVGDTLWVLDEKLATKIPFSDLDIDATQQENRSRGVRFLIPGK